MPDAIATADAAAEQLSTSQGREQAGHDVKSTAASTVGKVKSEAAKTVDDAQDGADDLSGRAQAAADGVRRRVGEASSAARDWAVDQSDVLRDTVQTKPFIAVGVSAASAFAAGLVLGVLLTRR